MGRRLTSRRHGHPSGRVYRLRPSGQLDLLLANAPSPNGGALDRDGRFLFIAVTRGNAVWRAPVLADGSLSKVGLLRTFFGTSGPNRMAVDVDNRLVVAHASLGSAFVLDAMGQVTHFVRSPVGGTVTNVAFPPGTNRLVMTESASECVLEADLPAPGTALYRARETRTQPKKRTGVDGRGYPTTACEVCL